MSDFTFEEVDIDTDYGEEIEEEIPPAVVCDYPGCDTELVWLGRGRKPKWCPEHKGGKAALASKLTTQASTRIKGTNEQLAAQAAAVLAKSNSLAMLAILAFGMPVTATAIAEHNEEFERNAYDALLLDPALCKKILSTGGKTAGIALFMAYGQLGMFVVPLAISEIKDKREAKRKELEDAAAS